MASIQSDFINDCGDSPTDEITSKIAVVLWSLMGGMASCFFLIMPRHFAGVNLLAILPPASLGAYLGVLTGRRDPDLVLLKMAGRVVLALAGFMALLTLGMAILLGGLSLTSIIQNIWTLFFGIIILLILFRVAIYWMSPFINREIDHASSSLKVMHKKAETNLFHPSPIWIPLVLYVQFLNFIANGYFYMVNHLFH